ncbi:MAG: glycosyltransferase family 4 protein [Chloroflexi bacterium]|nr:glycosyltransferase family 4 protein [Chloroflexota bacterium]
MYRVAFYSPDSHVCYDIETLDHHGVGGGITARTRMAHALAGLGCDVAFFNNCPEAGMKSGVRYMHYRNASVIKTDVFIASTSGDGQNLGGLSNIQVKARLRLLMVHGLHPPQGIGEFPFDYYYAASEFVRTRVLGWGIGMDRIFVAPRGVVGSNFALPDGEVPRDPFSLVYASHPDKGLQAAIEVLKRLRKLDRRYTLHYFGGEALWGGNNLPKEKVDGFQEHGLIGQVELAGHLQECGFSLNLQDIQETFGMTVLESMRGGCIPLASRVGAYPEIVQHGINGFLVEGDHRTPAVHDRAARLVDALVQNPPYAAFIRRNALLYPFEWSRIASAWLGHWNWILKDRMKMPGSMDLDACPLCRGAILPLADGLHCVSCGFYRRGPAKVAPGGRVIFS